MITCERILDHLLISNKVYILLQLFSDFSSLAMICYRPSSEGIEGKPEFNYSLGSNQSRMIMLSRNHQRELSYQIAVPLFSHLRYLFGVSACCIKCPDTIGNHTRQFLSSNIDSEPLCVKHIVVEDTHSPFHQNIHLLELFFSKDSDYLYLFLQI